MDPSASYHFAREHPLQCSHLINSCQSFLPFAMEKDVKILKKLIMTSERWAKQLFAGQNTQQLPEFIFCTVRHFLAQ